MSIPTAPQEPRRVSKGKSKNREFWLQEARNNCRKLDLVKEEHDDKSSRLYFWPLQGRDRLFAVEVNDRGTTTTSYIYGNEVKP